MASYSSAFVITATCSSAPSTSATAPQGRTTPLPKMAREEDEDLLSDDEEDYVPGEEGGDDDEEEEDDGGGRSARPSAAGQGKAKKRRNAMIDDAAEVDEVRGRHGRRRGGCMRHVSLHIRRDRCARA